MLSWFLTLQDGQGDLVGIVTNIVDSMAMVDSKDKVYMQENMDQSKRSKGLYWPNLHLISYDCFKLVLVSPN